MTAIIGQTDFGKVFLATDTCRRDHATNETVDVPKLHQWSEQLLIAQGGAGSGAADEVISHLFSYKKRIGPSLSSVEKEISIVSPSIMSAARFHWEKNGIKIPPTFLVLASVCTERNIGHIRSIDLFTGKCSHQSTPPQAYLMGSNFRAIQASAGAVFSELTRKNPQEYAFDKLVTHTIENLSLSHGKDIHMPADIGFVRWDAATKKWQAEIVRYTSSPKLSDPRFSVTAPPNN